MVIGIILMYFLVYHQLTNVGTVIHLSPEELNGESLCLPLV